MCVAEEVALAILLLKMLTGFEERVGDGWGMSVVHDETMGRSARQRVRKHSAPFILTPTKKKSQERTKNKPP